MIGKAPTALSALVVFGGAILLSGCANQIYPEKAPLGNASKHNAAAHIVDPNPPVYETPPDMSGERSRGAIERYHRGTTITPEYVETSGEN